MMRALLAAALVVCLSACAPMQDGDAVLRPLDTSDPTLARGERVFARACQQCHPNASAGVGSAITGGPALPDWAVRFQVRHGLGQMPAFSADEISDAELDAVLAYLHVLRERASRGRPAS